MTKRQKLREIQKIIDKYIKVLQQLPSGGTIDPAMARRLGIPKDLKPLVEDAYKSGRLKGRTKARISKEILEQFFEELTPKGKDFTSIHAMEVEQDRALVLEKAKSRITRASIENLKRDFKVLETVFGEQTLPKRKMSSILREITKDVRQDLDMVVRAETVNTQQHAIAHEILEGTSPYSNLGSDSSVFKRPNPDACDHCKKHYLEKDGRTPKVFKLSELIENGTNYGKKVGAWQPVLGIMHPHCECQVSVLPEGTEFDEHGQIKIVKDRR